MDEGALSGARGPHHDEERLDPKPVPGGLGLALAPEEDAALENERRVLQNVQKLEEAAKSCCSETRKALKEYAQPKPTKVTAKVPATTNQP